MVDLGGSSVNNLADSLIAFGLVPGSANLVATTYTVFGDLVKSQYPELVPSYPPASQVIDASYLQGLARRAAPTRAVIARAKPSFKKPVKAVRTAVVGRRQWQIHFTAGNAVFSPDARKLLDRLSNDLLVAGGTTIEIHGHTDNQGDPRKSKPLSEARAFAVKKFLETRAPFNFPAGRIQVYAEGEGHPVAPNATPEGRALNRRVEIVLRSSY